jgi:hypothetical protein
MIKLLIRTTRILVIGGSLTFGLVFLLIFSSILLDKSSSKEDKSSSWIGFIMGIVPTAFGGLLILDGLLKQEEQLKQSHKVFSLELDSIFLEQVQTNQGHISCISFAKAAKISIEESEQYLEQKAKQLNNTSNIDDEGATSYHFPLPRSMM